MTGDDRDGVKNLACQTDDEIVFANAQQWFEYYSQCISRGDRPLPPRSRDELLLAEREGLFRITANQAWVPGRQGRQMLSLPDNFGRKHLRRKHNGRS